MTKKNKIILSVGIAVLVVLVAVLGILYATSRTPAQTGAKNITVELVLSDTEKKTVSINTDAAYLKEALDEKKLIDGQDGTYGFFITSVDGVAADAAKEEWWCITKGGEMVMTGVSETPIADGDKFELTLTVGY